MTYHISQRGKQLLGFTGDRDLWDVLTETGERVSTHKTRADAEHRREYLIIQQPTNKENSTQ